MDALKYNEFCSKLEKLNFPDCSFLSYDVGLHYLEIKLADGEVLRIEAPAGMRILDIVKFKIDME